jgi:hypothetical protein
MIIVKHYSLPHAHMTAAAYQFLTVETFVPARVASLTVTLHDGLANQSGSRQPVFSSLVCFHFL